MNYQSRNVKMLAVLGSIVATSAHGVSVERLSIQERSTILQVASTWKSGWVVQGKDAAKGPDGDNPVFKFNQEVDCRFETPQEQLAKKVAKLEAKGEAYNLDEVIEGMRPNGKTPKFQCLLDLDGDGKLEDYRVKYSEPDAKGKRINLGILGDVLGTRLAWLLGFRSDNVYPVIINCKGCPTKKSGGFLGLDSKTKGPWEYINDFFNEGGENPEGYEMQDRTFDFAAIEIKAKGKKVTYIDDNGDEENGFTFMEALSDENLSSDPELREIQLRDRYAHALFGAFIHHADNKSEQQRVTCKKSDRVLVDGNPTCTRAKMFIQDYGVTFGGGASISERSFNKVDVTEWLDSPMFDDPDHCIININNFFFNEGSGHFGLIEMPIDERGRKHLTELLNQVSDEQIADIFSRIPPQVQKYLQDDESRSLDNWVEAFKTKRAELNAVTRCPTVM